MGITPDRSVIEDGLVEADEVLNVDVTEHYLVITELKVYGELIIEENATVGIL